MGIFLAGGRPAPRSLLDAVYDQATGTYLGPRDSSSHEEWLEQFYGIAQDVPEEAQDLELKGRLRTLVTAVIDTGMLHAHPLLRDRIVAEADFTGEGAEDRHGHGTAVALLVSPVRFWPLINVKAIPGNGQGSREALVQALRYVRDYKRSHPEVLVVANVSIGAFSRRFLFFRCRGGCSICRAAREAAEIGVQVVAAAGNTAGRTACPAMLAVRKDVDGVFAVEAPDVPTSGRGTVRESGRPAPFVPVG